MLTAGQAYSKEKPGGMKTRIIYSEFPGIQSAEAKLHLRFRHARSGHRDADVLQGRNRILGNQPARLPQAEPDGETMGYLGMSLRDLCLVRLPLGPQQRAAPVPPIRHPHSGHLQRRNATARPGAYEGGERVSGLLEGNLSEGPNHQL